MPGRAHAGGGFGTCVELMDVDGDGRTEAVISHEPATVEAVRIVIILKATRSGLTGRGARLEGGQQKPLTGGPGGAWMAISVNDRHRPVPNVVLPGVLG